VNYKDVILGMKCETYAAAEAKSIMVRNSVGNVIGKLVPVGKWILDDREKIELVRAWREQTMRMFFIRFQSTFDRTFSYLKQLSIAQEGRIFFLVNDHDDRFVGHMGIADVDGNNGELDNVVRGVAGGNPRLIYFAELALLDWCFKSLGIGKSGARVLSYNWLVISLHEDVGYSVQDSLPLKRYERDGVTFHDIVDNTESNVKYRCTTMMLSKEEFYKKASWLD
jgi:RimJ/RimL family protein N-acetyltransferase